MEDAGIQTDGAEGEKELMGHEVQGRQKRCVVLEMNFKSTHPPQACEVSTSDCYHFTEEKKPNRCDII